MVHLFAYALLTTALNTPYPTEGDGIYAHCGIPGCCEMCFAVCTPLCVGRCAACLCCLLFSFCRDFDFSTVHDMFFRNKQKRVRAHPSTPCTAYNQCVPRLGKIKKSRRREVLCTPHACCPTLLFPFPEHVWRQFSHHLAMSLTPTRTTTTN